MHTFHALIGVLHAQTADCTISWMLDNYCLMILLKCQLCCQSGVVIVSVPLLAVPFLTGTYERHFGIH